MLTPLRILAVHNRYLIAGGEDSSHQAEVALLRQAGHQVDEWVEDNQRVAKLGQAQTDVRTIWSWETYQQARHRLGHGRYHLVYIQNFFPLISPSIYYAARAERVPVVQTLRNYRLLCPNALFFREGQVCELCLGKFIPWPGIRHACYRGSRAGSSVVAAMITTHRLLRTWQRMVTRYVVLTEFARQKFIQGGLPAEKLIVKPNFVAPDPGVGAHNGRFALFVGRLSEEKGLDVLLEAWRRIGTKLPLRLVGDGPLAGLAREGAATIPGVSWDGRLPNETTLDLMKQATLFIFPSMCYEGLPRTIVEAYAVGLPVVAGNLGSMSTLVQHGRTGQHFQPGNAHDLASQVQLLVAEPQRLAAMQQAARQEYEEKFTLERNYEVFTQIFAQIQPGWK